MGEVEIETTIRQNHMTLVGIGEGEEVGEGMEMLGTSLITLTMQDLLAAVVVVEGLILQIGRTIKRALGTEAFQKNQLLVGEMNRVDGQVGSLLFRVSHLIVTHRTHKVTINPLAGTEHHQLLASNLLAGLPMKKRVGRPLLLHGIKQLKIMMLGKRLVDGQVGSLLFRVSHLIVTHRTHKVTINPLAGTKHHQLLAGLPMKKRVGRPLPRLLLLAINFLRGIKQLKIMMLGKRLVDGQVGSLLFRVSHLIVTHRTHKVTINPLAGTKHHQLLASNLLAGLPMKKRVGRPLPRLLLLAINFLRGIKQLKIMMLGKRLVDGQVGSLLFRVSHLIVTHRTHKVTINPLAGTKHHQLLASNLLAGLPMKKRVGRPLPRLLLLAINFLRGIKQLKIMMLGKRLVDGQVGSLLFRVSHLIVTHRTHKVTINPLAGTKHHQLLASNLLAGLPMKKRVGRPLPRLLLLAINFLRGIKQLKIMMLGKRLVELEEVGAP
ncbi:protein RNA-directed DNA methylation 3 [Iris pallida]|uniref:Protein RNA-directed DNA methylation 3 n=1 Tax=Iris pallida TaxID=29817 RepID=A0AAX6E138_IRIPA|nr:protein RNA-directed DNA methylation 3 [Iris pallida]